MDSRSGYHVFLYHCGPEVVGAEKQGQLGNFGTHRHPGRLDVVEVVEHEP